MTAAASSPFPTAPVVVGATHQHDPQLLAPTSGSSLLRPRAPSRTASSASTASNNPFYDPDDPLTGHVGHLNEPQQQALAAFKALAFAEKLYVPEPPTFDEATLLRFLRARRWDPPSALKQLKEAEAWRKTSNVDEFFRNHEISTFEDARKVYPVWTGRRTKSGHPFYVYRVQDLDKKSMARYLENSSKKSATPGAKHPATVVALYQYLLECMCPLMTMLKDRPHPEVPISASCNIVDISGVSIMQFFGLRGHLGDASTLATARYPETLDSILIVGAPPYMDTVFSFISQFFDAQTRAKIKILGSATDPAATLAGLREYIHDADIPKAYGGGLDWEFGGRPNIDPEIKRAFGLEDDFEWPEGPVAIDAERGEIQAVGTRANGKRRREVIAEIKPDAYDVD